MKIVTAILAAWVLAIALPAAGAPRIKAPKEGRGVVVFELVNPGLIIGDKTDYTIVTGHRDSAGDGFIQESLIRSFPLFRDASSGKLWLIDDVPAGETVLWGFNVHTGWQARFDGGTLHFEVPDRGYIFGGAIDGTINRARISDAVAAGILPSQKRSDLLMAICGQSLTGYTTPDTASDGIKAAERFLNETMNNDIKLKAATTDIAPFIARQSSGFVNAPTHSCVADKP